MFRSRAASVRFAEVMNTASSFSSSVTRSVGRRGGRPPSAAALPCPLAPAANRKDMMKLAEFRINLPSYLQPDDVFAELIRISTSSYVRKTSTTV